MNTSALPYNIAYPCHDASALSNAGLSDHMSRSIMTLLLPSPPTASQMMMADIENCIVETKNLHIFAVCVKLAGWALLAWLLQCGTFNLCRCHGARGWYCNGSRGNDPPPFNVDSRVHFGLCRPKCSDPTGDGSSASCGWHAMDTRQGRPERAETGLIGRSPTTSVGAHVLSAAPWRTRAYPFLSILIHTLIHSYPPPRVFVLCYERLSFCMDKRDFSYPRA